MASISFYAPGLSAPILTPSGIGYFGSAGFANSIAVGAFNKTSFLVDSAGTTNGGQVWNIEYANIGSGYVGGAASGIPLISIPNYQCLEGRFTHSSAVRTQNAKMYFYDRVSLNNDPSGVLVKAASVIHPNLTQFPTGSGSTVWVTPHGSAVTLTLPSSPGLSGLSPNGNNTQDQNHSHYIAISVSPNEIGSKLFSGAISLEYF